MAITPETLVRHELIGLRVRVVDAPNPDIVGIAGRVVDETMHTLVVGGEDARVRQVPKSGTTFEFALTDDAAAAREGAGIDAEPTDEAGAEPRGEATARAGGEATTYVTVDGARLLSRPATRTEVTGDTTWR